MNEQQRFWASEYSSEYIKKNSHYDLSLGKECWANMLKKTSNIGSLLECGSNIGRNIDCLKYVLPAAEKSIIEISPEAYHIAISRLDLAYSFNGSIVDSQFPVDFDLVFTSGVLIHIHPSELLANMNKIYAHSRRYILINEYFNRTPVMIEYQGKRDKLFKMDFGKIFAEQFPVRLVDYGFLWGHIYDIAGFDDTTWWLFEKNE